MATGRICIAVSVSGERIRRLRLQYPRPAHSSSIYNKTTSSDSSPGRDSLLSSCLPHRSSGRRRGVKSKESLNYLLLVLFLFVFLFLIHWMADKPRLGVHSCFALVLDIPILRRVRRKPFTRNNAALFAPSAPCPLLPAPCL